MHGPAGCVHVQPTPPIAVAVSPGGSVSVTGGTSNGRADLLLYQTASRSRSSLQGDECVTREQPASFRSTTLRFDGKRYRSHKGATP